MRKYLLSSSEWQASVRSVKLRSATLCTGVFLFYIKRHLMSGNELACSLGSSSAKIAWVWTQQTRWKTLANNVRRYSSRCVRALRQKIYVTLEQKNSFKSLGYVCSNSQKYILWVKIIDLSFMPKIIRILSKDLVPWRYFVPLNISKLHFWLVICTAKNFIWATLKKRFRFFAPSDSRFSNSCISVGVCDMTIFARGR